MRSLTTHWTMFVSSLSRVANSRRSRRTRRSMIFSPIRKRVDDLAYGLGDLVCPLLVENPHDPNSPPPAASARRAVPFFQVETSVAGPPSATAPCLKVDRCDIFAK